MRRFCGGLASWVIAWWIAAGAMAADEPNLKSEIKDVQGLKVMTLRFNAKGVLPCMIWADPEGKSFLALDGNSLLQVSFPDLKVTRTKNFGKSPAWLSISREGLLLSIRDRREVLVIDADTWEVKKTIGVPSLRRAVSAPGLSLAFACEEKPDPKALFIVDLAKGTVKEWPAPKNLPAAVGSDVPTATPDGKYLITMSDGKLHRFRIGPDSMQYEESTPKMAGEAKLEYLNMSADSKWVGLPLYHEGAFARNLLNVFDVRTFKKPDFAIEEIGGHPVGFDVRGGCIYALNFRLFGATGILKKQYYIPDADGSNPKQWLVHPAGNLVLMLNSDKLLLIDVPKEQPLVTASPDLNGTQRKLDDLDVAKLTLDGKRALPCMLWADAAGKSFLLIDERGVLTRIAYPEFRIAQQVDFARRVSWMSDSREGFLLSLPDRHEVWVVDRNSLEIKRKIEVPFLKRAVSASGLSTAFACDRLVEPQSLWTIDLVKGTAAKWVPDNLPKAVGFDRPVMTPDGQYLMTISFARISRFRVEQNSLKYEQSTPEIASGNNDLDIQVSADSKWVCWPTGGGNIGLQHYDNYVYSTKSFTKSEFTLQENQMQPVGFDPKGECILAGALKVHGSGGGLKKRYAILDGHVSIRQVLVHPEGSRAMLVGESGLFSVSLPRRDTTATAREADLKAPWKQLRDVKAMTLALDATGALGCMIWADPEGKSFLLSNDAGVLRRISYPDLKVVQTKDLERRIAWMTRSSHGLLISIPDRQEVWVVDPATLEVKSKIAVPSLKCAVSAANLAVAFAYDQNRTPVTLYVLDLRTGTAAKWTPPKTPANLGVESLAVSPDGNFLFIEYRGQTHRFKIDNGALKYEESIAAVASGPNNPGIQISPDSKLIYFPAYRSEPMPVYSTANFKTKEFTLQGVDLNAVGFDAKGGYIYSGGINLYSSTGRLVNRYPLVQGLQNTKQLLVHPGGNAVLILDPSKLHLVEVPAKKAVAVALPTELKTPWKEVDDLKVMTLNVDAKSIPGCLVWADKEGKSFFFLNSNGALWHVSYPDLKIVKIKEFDAPITWLSMSAEGLLLSLPQREQVWLVDPDKLEIKSKIEVRFLARAVSAPGLSLAVASEGNIKDPRFAVVDLKNGKSTRWAIPKDLPKNAGFNSPVMTPNGKYLIASGLGALSRYKIDQGRLAYEETSPTIGGAIPCVSADSQWVCLPNIGGNQGVPPRTINVYRTTDLKKAAFTLEKTASESVGFDPKAGNIYTAAMNVHGMNGAQKKTYSFFSGVQTNQQVLVHPAGHQVLLLRSSNLFLVEVPNK